MYNTEIESRLSPEEISFLEEKKSSLLMYLVLSVIGLAFSYVICFAVLNDIVEKTLLGTITSIIFLIPITRNSRQISKINKDIASGIKKILTTRIDDYKELVNRDQKGRRISSEYYFSLEGEKYKVKEEHFYPIGRGDLVKAEVSTHSKYAFHIEKIRAESKPTNIES